jgi:hypothetical protein
MAKKAIKSEDIFEDVQETNDTTVKEQSSLEKMIERTDPKWHEFVMSLFSEDELVEGMPKVAGLRRVSEKLYGQPHFSGPIQIFPSNEYDNPGRSTVLFSVQFSHATYQEVADSWIGNTDDAFAVYGIAMASTRAEARALRKALGLHGAAFEEITSKDTASIARETSNIKSSGKTTTGEKLEGGASSAQMNLINKLVDRANIDIDALFKSFDTTEKTITKDLASKTIDMLNCYVNKSVEIPEHIRR